MATYFYGDPHGDFAPLLRQASDMDHRDLVVIVGDLDLMGTFRATLASLFERGVTLKYIIGNHDVDREHRYDMLMTYPEGDVGGDIYQYGQGPRIAGLGGVFLASIWYPRPDPDVAWTYENRTDRLVSLPHQRRWRKGLPLRERGAVFPWDCSRFDGFSADILVSHEAPTTHKYGFQAIDRVAAGLGVRWVVHGHHHRSYEGQLPGGVRVRGLGIAELWRLPEE